MAISTQFAILALFLLSAFSEVSQGQGIVNLGLFSPGGGLRLGTNFGGGFNFDTNIGGGIVLQNPGVVNKPPPNNILQTTATVTEAFTNLIKQVTMPPQSTAFQTAWAGAVMHTIKFLFENFFIVVKQLIDMSSESSEVDEASANAILQATAENDRLFTSTFAQLLESFEVKRQTGTVDDARARAIMQTIIENNRAFTAVFTRSAELLSKAGRTEDASAVMQAVDVITGSFANMIKTLLYTPLTVSGLDSRWTNEALQMSDVITGAFTNLIKQLAEAPKSPPPTPVPTPPPSLPPSPPPKNVTVVTKSPPPQQCPVADNSWASADSQEIIIKTEAISKLFKQLTSPPQLCSGLTDAWASAVKQSTGVAAKAFTSILEQLLFPPSGSITKETAADNSRAIAIKQATAQSTELFTKSVKGLVALFLKGSQTDAIGNAWTSVVMQTANVLNAGYTNLMTQLENSPSAGMDNAWASKVIQSTNVVNGAYTILIEELLFATSSGMAKNVVSDRAQASVIQQALDQHLEAFANVIQLLMT